MQRNAKSIAICAFLDKPTNHRIEIEAEYVGKAVPDEFVIGYGLDFDGFVRNLDAIYKIKS